MSKPFQISIRRLLAATALFGAVICLLRVAFGPHNHPSTVESGIAGPGLEASFWNPAAFATGATWRLGIGAITETSHKLTLLWLSLGYPDCDQSSFRLFTN